MKQKLPTVTVILSAYNEADNIEAFLRSVLSQRQSCFVLKRILIISDGSTDGTPDIAKSLSSPLIKVKHFSKRAGKSTRLNQLYDLVSTDYIIQSDADVTFADSSVIQRIIRTFERNPSVKMCAGLPIPVDSQTFTEHAENEVYKVYCSINKTINGGTNGFTPDGRILAYRTSFAKTLHIPEDMIANDLYTYMVVRDRGEGYRFVPKARVYFRSPRTLHDKIRQCIRFTAAAQRMRRHFPQDLVAKECTLPIHLNVKSKLAQVLTCPIEGIYMYGIYKYCAYIAKRKEHTLTARWDMAVTTKNLQPSL